MKEFEEINAKDKEKMMKTYYSWLFEREDIQIEKEFLPRLAQDYQDPYMYYPRFVIGEFFDTDVMKRLQRVSQLGVGIREKKDCVEDRLEHSKGCFYNGLEEQIMLWQQNEEYRKYIEEKSLKPYLIAELIKKAAHDNGHMPLSHVIEVSVTNTRNYHEKIGKRNLLENEQIQSILSKVPGLQQAMRKVLEEDVLNFKIHDEGNCDTDRQDFLFGDYLYYDGDFLNIHLGMYERKFGLIDENGKFIKNEDGSIKLATEKDARKKVIDIYPYAELKNIEKILEERIRAYREGHFSEKRQVQDRIPSIVLNKMMERNENNGQRLIKYLEMIKSTPVENIDLDYINQMDEIIFYLDIIKAAENTTDEYMKQIIPMAIPNLENFMHMIYRYLNLHDKNAMQYLSVEQKELIYKIKDLLHSDSELARRMKNPNYEKENLLIVRGKENIQRVEANLGNELLGLLNKSKSTVKGYKVEEPIYIYDSKGRVFSLDTHPERSCNWQERIYEIEVAFCMIPDFKEAKLSNSQIDQIYSAFGSVEQIEDRKKHRKINMSPIRTETRIEEIYENIDER